MFGQRVDETFVNDPSRAGAPGGGGGTWLLLLLILIGLTSFAVWASLFEIEEVTRGTGRVVPSSQIQLVQSLDAGIVRSINVREGDIVEQGQSLMQIDDTAAAAKRGELLEREAALLAEEIRLKAEVALNRSPTFPGVLTARAGAAVLAEMDVLASRFQQLDNELEVLENKLTQKRAALAELRAQRAKLEGVAGPLREEAEMTVGLADSGAVPRIELLRLQSRLAEVTGNLAVSAAQEPNLLAAIDEAKSEIAVARSSYILTARQRLARLGVELAVVREELRAAQDKVSRTQLTAPIRGTVNSVNVTTIGEVFGPGARLVEIVPIDDSLQIEVDILPQDVAFIRPGDTASVKISAYNYLVYGALDGTVERIGADTRRGSDEQDYFQVTIRTNTTNFGTDEAPLPVTPGMTASIDIQTGRRSVLSYLVEPILRVGSEALRER